MPLAPSPLQRDFVQTIACRPSTASMQNSQQTFFDGLLFDGLQVNAAIHAHRIDTPGKEARAKRHSRFALAMVSRMPLAVGDPRPYSKKVPFVSDDSCDGSSCRPPFAHGANTLWRQSYPEGKTFAASNHASLSRWQGMRQPPFQTLLLIFHWWSTARCDVMDRRNLSEALSNIHLRHSRMCICVCVCEYL